MASPDRSSPPPNVFQRLMLQWERFAPYNAGQYMTLVGDLPTKRAMHAFDACVVGLGLDQIGQVDSAAAARSSGALPPDRPADADPIATFVSAELNRPFAADDPPLRPFVIRGDGVTHVGLIYRHVVADSASIRLIMRAWFERLYLDRTPARVSLAGDLGPRRSLWQTARIAIREFARLRRVKRVRRLPAERADPTSAVAWRRIDWPNGAIDRALAAARRRGVKLNDVFLAAAAMACRDLMPLERPARRTDLGIGTIVDVRPADRPAQTHFGLSLGFLQTFWRPDELTSLDAALAAAAAASRSARENGDADASLLRLTFAERFCRSRCLEDTAEFYRKRCPLAAGISNVNLNRDWPAAHHPSPLVNYTRISPLGPMLPLVFTPTTLGTRANLGLTYRTSVLDDAAADAVIAAFLRRVGDA